ncbi:hypothetical protein [Patulibacter defluvii]|uniref:hypothetical protein n=1 Tax=Patulibacter defluvii TaxID=3095358 RepID=UPI002A74CF49|nr:hypothetical protein [Patulibacter sp. DM4]
MRPDHRTSPRGEDGFALVELLTVCALLAGVTGALLSLAETAGRVVPRDVEWTHVVADGRTGLRRIARELRQADRIHGATPNAIDFEVTVGGRARRVMIACDVSDAADERRCVRVEAAPGATLPPPAGGPPLVVRLRNGTPADPVFRYTPDAIAPRHVAVRIRLRSNGERRAADGPLHDVVLDDGAYLRNQDLTGG